MDNGQPLIEGQDRSIEGMARLFVSMSERILLNKDAAFGGALVIVPPKEGGDPLEMLILDSRQDVAQFWSLVKSKAEMELARLVDVARQQSAFRGR